MLLTPPRKTDLALVARAVINLPRQRANRELVGLRVARRAERISQPVIDRFAEATADESPRYRGRNALAPPLLVARLFHPLIRELLAHPGLHVNLLRIVHAEQALSWHRPLRPGQQPELALRLAEVRTTPAGDLLVLRGEARADGQLATEYTTGLMVRALRRRPEEGSPEPPAHRTREITRLSLATAPDQPRRYARISGDANPIHLSRVVARLAGFPGPILHGMCVLAMTCGALCRRCLGGEVERLAGISARFSRPALPGRVLSLVALEQPAGRPAVEEAPGAAGATAEERGFEVENEQGELVLSRGVLRVT